MSGIYFDGQNVVRPQVRSKVDASGLTPVVLGSANVLMIFGIASGGIPNHVYTLSDPAQAKAIFRSGDLLKGAQRAWNPSPNLSGASVIKMVRIGATGIHQGEITLKSSVPTDLLKLTSLDYGVWTNSIQVKVETGSTSGLKITVNYLTTYEVYDNLATVASAVSAINALSGLVSATLILEGTLAIASYAPLTLGLDGTAVSADWQASFELAKTNPADLYTATTDTASIQALLLTVVNYMSTTGQHEARMYVGYTAGETVAQIKARALAFGSSRVLIATPGVKQYDDNGVLATEGAVFTACMIAGLRAGLPLEEPITFKYLNGVGLEVNYTPDQIDEFDQAGVCAVEAVPNKGYRIAHGQTTYLQDTNVLFREESVRGIADAIMGEVRGDALAFVGRPGSKTTIGSIKIRLASKLDLIKLNGWITDGVDNAGNFQPAYRNLIVRFDSASQIVYFEFEASPVTPINYVLITGHFRATNIVA